jgi:ribose transport system substrate-binding protein
MLAQNYSNTVILIGGVLQPDGNTITSTLGETMFKDLYIKTAFVSCAGFTLETGLTETDFRQAQLKNRMISYASRIVALVDSSKFGRVGLAPFATANQIAQIVTDDGLDAKIVEQLTRAKIGLTICGEESVDSMMPHVVESQTHTIGFANLSEEIPFAIDVRRSLERASQYANVDLVLADNQLSGETALSVADHLIARGVELAIEYQIDEKIGNVIINKFHQANIPVIAVDIPMVGATYFGVDNYHAGHLAGVALGKWIENQWQNCVDTLLVLEEARSGTLTGARIQGQLNGLTEVIGQNALSNPIFLDSGNTREISETNVLSAMQSMPDQHHIAVICFNDDAAVGALTAARRLHREQDVVIVGQGADRRVREEIRRPSSRIIGSTAFAPEKYGEKLIDLAIRILRGERVPPAVYMEHTFLDAENIHLFYPE